MDVAVIDDFLYRLRALLRRDRADADLADELRFHLDERAAQLERAGVAAGDARRRARLELGGLAQAADRTRDAWTAASSRSHRT